MFLLAQPTGLLKETLGWQPRLHCSVCSPQYAVIYKGMKKHSFTPPGPLKQDRLQYRPLQDTTS